VYGVRLLVHWHQLHPHFPTTLHQAGTIIIIIVCATLVIADQSPPAKSVLKK
jgi:hypothetical protein